MPGRRDDAGVPQRIEPGAGQESAWDYPRPPRVERSNRRVRVMVGGVTVADSARALRVLETYGAPVWYLPSADVRLDLLTPSQRQTHCEWKGAASYFDIRAGGRDAKAAAWTYHRPEPGYEAIRGHIAFYASKVDTALVDDEKARPQPGGFYGGWVTADVVGPFKGEPGMDGR